uniref:AP2/ERF domain-containing protein n=3 Tax=Gossypium raimondii TaxID=29730 RepID=A0A0D2R0P2_GOSRA|nr:hypothetical protein B456_010G021900 [Gossypium raimondii]
MSAKFVFKYIRSTWRPCPDDKLAAKWETILQFISPPTLCLWFWFFGRVPAMEGDCCSSSTSSSTSGEKPKAERTQQKEKPYRGIRMRKWGKWVAEIREPNKRSRIWLGSYTTPVAAARAYDIAVFYLRGPSARLNFPDLIEKDNKLRDISATSIRKKAAEVGAKVDALQTSSVYHHGGSSSDSPNNTRRVLLKPDLNKYPEISDED